MRLIVSHLRREMTSNGVRRIPINVRSLTGEVDGQQFESSLERDAHLLVHWDYWVEWYQSQPVVIEYVDKEGKARRYTPDLLVMYRKELLVPGRSEPKRPLLAEIKYREDLAKNWKLLKPKFRAARAYARERDWDFAILTEREIRTPLLKNVQFLWRYRFADFHTPHYRCLRDTLRELEETDPKTLLEATYQSQVLRGEALWTLWCMVARRWIGCDLSQSLTMTTRIWSNE
jgi:hypothetical protein